MGRNTTEVPFFHNAGGINESINPGHTDEQECLAAYNVYFDVNQNFGSIYKRVGYERLNSTALNGKIESIYQTSLGGTDYLFAFTTEGTLYSINLDTYVGTSVQSGLQSGVRAHFASLSAKAYILTQTNGLYYSTDGTTWTAVADANKPNGKYCTVFRNRLMVANSTTYPNRLWYSADGDGTDWTDTSPVTYSTGYIDLDTSDNDYITGLATIGEQLIVFKQHSIYRVFFTADTTTVPYQVVPIYGNIGCESQESIKQIQIDDQEVLTFIGDTGLYALGVNGNPVDLTAKVKTTYSSIQKSRLGSCIGLYNPRRKLYHLAYPQGSQFTCSRELTLSLRPKAWSIWDIRMTAAITYTDTLQNYIIFGDGDGYLYKHDWRQTNLLADYSDNGTAITSYWQSFYFDWKLPRRYKQLFSLTTTIAETPTNCPISTSILAEDSLSVTGTIATVTGVGSAYDSAVIGTDVFAPDLGYVDYALDTGLYCQTSSIRFENSNDQQYMAIHGFSVELKGTKNKKGV